jgi:DNA-binding GntR family transcriptional regulator
MVVRKAIRDGVIEPGGFYSEQQIATALTISRTPVREALIELAREGIVEKIPQRGFRLRNLSREELDEVFQLRELLESYVASRLAAVATPEQVRALEAILDKQAAVRHDPTAFLEFDEEFHLTMAGMLGLSRTQQLLYALRGIIWIVGAAAIERSNRVASVLDEHRAILESIAVHDVAGATLALHEHVRATRAAASTALHVDASRADLTSEDMVPRPATRMDAERTKRRRSSERNGRSAFSRSRPIGE